MPDRMSGRMPDAPIVDAHVHLWDRSQFARPWLDAVPPLRQPFGLSEFRDQANGLPISGMVYVETGVAPPFALLEAEWAVAQAQREPRLQAVVAAAPLEDGAQVRSYVEALRALGPLVKGVRRNLQDEADPAFCLRPRFLLGVSLLAEYGLSCDLCIRQEQLPAVTMLVRQSPAVVFVLDHLGKPAIKAAQLDPWRERLAALAALPNVACKISGLVTEADMAQWQPEDLAPYVRHALEVFGPDRVLFGGDWPVLLLASSYQRWVETLATLTAHLSPEQRRQLWGNNARRWYRLPASE